jgi:hypothetical protein
VAAEKVIERVRRMCLALPETSERPSHGEVGFFVRRAMFLMTDDHHHGVEHVGFWCAAPPGAQEALIAEDPARFFRPPYVGHRGWLGVRLSGPVPPPDWGEIGVIVRDAYDQRAPARLRLPDR